MPRKRYTPEEILQNLRTVELKTGKGLAVLDACRKLGITEQTYYRSKKEYGRQKRKQQGIDWLGIVREVRPVPPGKWGKG